LELEIITDGQGRFVISELPAGDYWIKIADQTIGIQVTTEEQLLRIPRQDGGVIEIVVPAAVGGVGMLTPTPTIEINPIFQTSTALAVGSGVPSSTPTLDPTMPETGLFTGEGDDITATDLLILAVIGMVLVGIVLAARRLRSPV
jgi:hypothetical protein